MSMLRRIISEEPAKTRLPIIEPNETLWYVEGQCATCQRLSVARQAPGAPGSMHVATSVTHSDFSVSIRYEVDKQTCRVQQSCVNILGKFQSFSQAEYTRGLYIHQMLIALCSLLT